jgi:hypothetical protein
LQEIVGGQDKIGQHGWQPTLSVTVVPERVHPAGIELVDTNRQATVQTPFFENG